MTPKVALALSALILLAGSAGASAQYASRHHWPVGPGARAYALDQGISPRCLSAWQRYNTAPPGGVIQDRGYQQNVLGIPWC